MVLGGNDGEDVDEGGGEVMGRALRGSGFGEEGGDWVGMFKVGGFRGRRDVIAGWMTVGLEAEKGRSGRGSHLRPSGGYGGCCSCLD